MSDETETGTGTRENPLRAEKRKKLQALRELGLNPFPHNFKTHASGRRSHRRQSVVGRRVSKFPATSRWPAA